MGKSKENNPTIKASEEGNSCNNDAMKNDAKVLKESMEEVADIFYAPCISGSELSIYHCGRHICLPDHSFGPYKREFYFLHFIIKGKGIFLNDGNLYHLEQNQGFLIRPSEEHYYKADTHDPWGYYFVAFHGTIASQIINSIDWENGCIITPTNAGAIIECFKNMYLNANPSLWSQYRMLGELYSLLSYMLKDSKRSKSMIDTPNADDIVSSAIKFICERFALSISINDIAAFCNVERTTLFRKFKREMNISPQDYLLDYRLERAASYLFETELPCHEIALAVGMQDYPHFCKLFKKKYLMSPTTYRKVKKQVSI